MYYYAWDAPPIPGGSYATHPAHAIFHNVLIVIASLDVILQSYTVYLILRVAKSELNEYRYFIMLSTSCDMCLAVTLGFVVQPHPHSPLFSCASARGAAAIFGHEGARISVILVYTFAVALVVSQAYSMIYRVTAVLKDPRIKRRFLSTTLVAFCMLLMAGITVGMGYAIHKTTARQTMLSPLLSVLGPFVYIVGGMLQLYWTPLEAFHLCLVGISLFPIINAVLTIIFVRPYRLFTTQWIKAALKADLRAAVEQSSMVTPASGEVARLRNAFRTTEENRRNVFCTGANRVYPSPQRA